MRATSKKSTNSRRVSAPKVSILTPIYNVEKYLRQCLDSIVAQTLKDIEIICINDGSTDSSPSIIREYAEKDPRVIVITKKNSGYGDSMNRGLKKATGEYIGIVESDDFIEPNMFEELYDLAEKHRVEVVKSNFFHYHSGDNTKFSLVNVAETGRAINPDRNNHTFRQMPAIWSAIYRRDFLLKNDIGFLPSPGASYQDTGFNFKVWVMAKKVFFTDEAYLHYRIDNLNSSIYSNDKKVFCVKNEYDEIERYLTVKKKLSEFGPLMTSCRYAGYLWNIENLSADNARKFVDVFSQDLRTAQQKNILDLSLFTDKDRLNVEKIMQDPQAFLRHKLMRARLKKVYKAGLKVLRFPVYAIVKVISIVSLSYRHEQRIIHTAQNIIKKSREIHGKLERIAKASRTEPRKDISPAVSIIVPVWNTGKYTTRCLESLTQQTLSNIEIVCVNDGSTDESLSILHDFAKKDHRIIVINNKRNLGPAHARNVALQHVSAPYIMSCDSDDYYAPTMCEEMYHTMITQDVDCVICGMNVISEVPDKLLKDVVNYVGLKYKGRQHLSWQKILNTDVSMPNKIFKKSIIDQYHISYPDGLFYEDAYFCDAYFTVADTIYYLHRKLYHYIRHGSSIMSTSFKKTGLGEDYLKIATKTYDYLKTNGIFEQYNDFFWRRFIQYYAFARDNLHGEAKKNARDFTKRFIVEHQSEFDMADIEIRDGLLALISSGHKAKWLIKRVGRKLRGATSLSYRRKNRIEQLQQDIIDDQQAIETQIKSIKLNR